MPDHGSSYAQFACGHFSRVVFVHDKEICATCLEDQPKYTRHRKLKCDDCEPREPPQSADQDQLDQFAARRAEREAKAAEKKRQYDENDRRKWEEYQAKKNEKQ